MKKYVFLPHTADAQFQAFGRSLEEAFANAALAVASLMWDWAAVEPRTRTGVNVAGKDLPQLLYVFLEEILYLLDTKGFVLAGVENVRVEQEGKTFRLRADFLGDTSPDKYEFHGSVKAVTYSEMMVETSGTITVQVVVDM